MYSFESPITNELVNMKRLLAELDIGTDSNRDRTVLYHRLTVSLSRAVKYWPMARFVIIVIAGVIQAIMIVRYLETLSIFQTEW